MKALKTLIIGILTIAISLNVMAGEGCEKGTYKMFLQNKTKNESVEVKVGASLKVVLHGGDKLVGEVTKIESDRIWIDSSVCMIDQIGKIKLRNHSRLETIKSAVAGAVIGTFAGVIAYVGFSKGFGVGIFERGGEKPDDSTNFYTAKVNNEKAGGYELTVEAQTSTF